MPGTDVSIVDSRGDALPDGEVGEMLIRFPGMAIGYWISPRRVDAFDDGFFHTGDLMIRQADCLHFVGRIKDLIVRGGSNISPVEVENVLRADPAVADVAVIGVPDQILGQSVVAFVSLTDGFSRSPAQILATAAEALADYKVPQRLLIKLTIPRNSLGKIDRLKLASFATEPPERSEAGEL